VVLVPAHPGAGAERVGDLRLRAQRTEGRHERAGHVERALGIGERERLLLGEGERAPRRVVLDVAARSLRPQPFGEVARGRADALGELLRGRGARRERAVEPEAVADDHPRPPRSWREIAHEAAEEVVELVLVDRHLVASLSELPGAGSVVAPSALRHRSVKRAAR
jgi:hypothetical protein